MTKKEIIERHLKLIEMAYSGIITMKNCNDRIEKGETRSKIYEDKELAVKMNASCITQLFKESFELINK